jgi:hypothetical protein
VIHEGPSLLVSPDFQALGSQVRSVFGHSKNASSERQQLHKIRKARSSAVLFVRIRMIFEESIVPSLFENRRIDTFPSALPRLTTLILCFFPTIVARRTISKNFCRASGIRITDPRHARALTFTGDH